jgi:hypothetical protein
MFTVSCLGTYSFNKSPLRGSHDWDQHQQARKVNMQRMNGCNNEPAHIHTPKLLDSKEQSRLQRSLGGLLKLLGLLLVDCSPVLSAITIRLACSEILQRTENKQKFRTSDQFEHASPRVCRTKIGARIDIRTCCRITISPQALNLRFLSDLRHVEYQIRPHLPVTSRTSWKRQSLT